MSGYHPDEYPWLTINEDGSHEFPTGYPLTPVEADRRRVISQEIRAGRVVPASHRCPAAFEAEAAHGA